MKKTKILLATMLLLAWAMPLSAQQDGPGEKAPNFFELRQQKLDKWAGVIPPPGNGYKLFKRWEYFWSARVFPDGSFPAPDHNEREWAKYQKEHPADADNNMQFPANWTSLGPNSSSGGYHGVGRINCIAFNPTDPNIIWVGTPAGGLWKSSDGGVNWTTNTDNLVSVMALGISSIALSPTTPNTMYIATGDKNTGSPSSVGILKSIDGGLSWNPTGALSAFLIYEVLVHPTINSTVLAATSNGIYRSTNGGDTWTQTQSGSGFSDIKFKPGSSSMVYAVNTDKFYRSTDGGVSWTQITTIPGSGRIQIAVTPANASFVALVSSNWSGGFNGFYTSTNSGGSLGLKYSGPKNLLNHDVNGGPSGGDGQGTYDLCIAVSPNNTNEIFIGGVNLWKSSDGGVSWNLANYWSGFGNPGVPTVHADKHSLVWQNNNTLFQGNDGGIYKSSNAGSTWTDLSNTLVISQIYRIGVSKSDSKVIIGLQDNSTKLRGVNGSWTETNSTGDGMENFIHPTNSNIMYSSSYYGALERSGNGGTSWSDISASQDGDWITPWAMDPNNPLILYAGYKDVWKSTNEGSTWTKISNNLSNINLTCLAVAPSNSNTIYTATQKTIWKSTTGGAPWTNISAGLPTSNGNMSYITVDPSDPNKLYVTFSGLVSGNKIFKSTNGGANWTNISGTLPNVSANCITVQPGATDALYIGTDLGVFFKSGAADWVAFNGGLPSTIVTELECKGTPTNKITAGTYGRGLWESNFNSSGTGNTLSVTPPSHAVSPPSGSVLFNVSSNVAYTVSDNALWLTCTPANGSGNGTFQASYSANTGLAARTATITITGPGGTPSTTATVVQMGVGGNTCNAPTGLQNNNISQTAATFRWNSVSGAASYSFQYRALPNGAWSNAITALSVTYTVNSLLPLTTYEWRVRSNCSNGLTSAWSTLLTFTTLPQPDCLAPDYLITYDITQTSVYATWTAVPGAVSYQLQTRRVPSGPWIDTNPAIFTSTTIFIYGFDECSWYEWRVRATCANGFTSPWANGEPFRTECVECEPPIDLFVTNITQNTAVLNWTAVPGALNYRVQFLSNGSWQNLSGPPTSGTSQSLYGLWANFEYTWRVIANCANGYQSDPSDENSFFAGYAYDCQIGTLWLDDLTPTSSWQYADAIWGGEYCVFNVNGGTTYTFSFCTQHNASLSFDGEIYLRSMGGTVIARTDDDCGLSPKLVWRAGFTGQVQVLLTRYECLDEQTLSKMAYRVGSFLTSGGSDDRSEDGPDMRPLELEPAIAMTQNKATVAAHPISSIEMTVFPNPASGNFNIKFDAGEDAAGSVTMNVYNPLGHIVWEKSSLANKGMNTWEVQTDKWPNGMYMVRLLNDQGLQCTQKIYVAKQR